VKGAKKLGVRLGNWLTVEEARRFWRRLHRVGNWIRSNSFSGTYPCRKTELSRLQAADSRSRE
jgi:hypothetical protein